MGRIGKCTDLSTVVTNIVQTDGGTGTWAVISAVKATFTVHLPAGSSCGGGASAVPGASCSLRGLAGTAIKVTVSGNGRRDFALPLAEASVVGRTGTLSMQGPGGGSSCSAGALVVTSGTNPSTWLLACGNQLRLNVNSFADNTHAPDLTITFTVEVIG